MDTDYEAEGVECSETGAPVCSFDDELCDVTACKHFVPFFMLGNCVLRVVRVHTLEEVGMALHISRERVRQLEWRALRKLKKRYHTRRELLNLDTEANPVVKKPWKESPLWNKEKKLWSG